MTAEGGKYSACSAQWKSQKQCDVKVLMRCLRLAMDCCHAPDVPGTFATYKEGHGHALKLFGISQRSLPSSHCSRMTQGQILIDLCSQTAT